MLPLADITVVSLEQAVAAPFATRQLADLGARVIKVERPGAGDFARHYDYTVRGMSSHFVWLNRSKESLTLDLKHPTALEALRRLIAHADVFVQNLAPGAADRLGLSPAALRAGNPRLITCSVSGYGSSGPYRDKKAYDLLIQCETGLVSITGTPESPAKTGISAADISAGMYAFSGILTALYQRERTGEGAELDISLFESLGEWMSYPMYFAVYGGTPPPRSGASHATIAPYGPFPTGDGRTVQLGIQNEREWLRFCEIVLQRPEVASDERFNSNLKRVANREALHATIHEVFGALTAEEVVARLDAAQIANARMNSVQEFWDHPQLKARERWRTVNTSAGELPALVPPITLNGFEPRMDPIPELGEQSGAILREVGLSDDEINALRDANAI